MSKCNLLRKRGIIMGGIMVLLIVILGCVNLKDKSVSSATEQELEQELELSTWITDWQWKSAIGDLSSITDGLTSVQVFAAYFDHTDHLFYTPENIEAVPKVIEIVTRGNHEVNVDLTVVNDRFEESGSAVQKDSALITRLMATPESRRVHIDDIVTTVTKYNFQGVEIDYEKIKDGDWGNICAFYKELYERLESMGKSLRIVLEPRTPIEKMNLPKGPVYVMMAYNLYGTHSGPGPKADFVFIDKMTKKMDQLPGEHFIAFATGGFDWPESGKIIAVTEQEAVKLARRSVQSPTRDEASGVLYFDYVDEKNAKHTVWYADGVALSQWIDRSKQAGYFKIALWRLGGFEQATLDYLNK